MSGTGKCLNFGHGSKVFSSSVYHGKVHQSLNFSTDGGGCELVGNDLFYNDISKNRSPIIDLDNKLNFIQKQDLATSPMDYLNDSKDLYSNDNFCNFIAKKKNYELKNIKKLKINR